MDSILQSIEDWFRELLVSGIMNNIGNTFDSVNNQVGQITARQKELEASEASGDWGQCHPTSKEHLWLQMHCLRKNKSTILAFPHGCSD